MTAVVVAIPNLDSPENGGTEGPLAYGNVWFASILDKLRAGRIPHRALVGPEDTRENVESAIAEVDPSLFLAVGHGASNLLTGQYSEEARKYVITLAKPGFPEIFGLSYATPIDNAEIMRGRVVYLLSCNTAKELGPYCIEKGATAFGGYDEEFVWVVESPESPETDRYARSFGDASTAFPLTLVGGKTVEEAKKEALRRFDEEIERWERSQDLKAREVVKWLLWNRDHFRVFGVGEAVPVEAPSLAPLLLLGGLFGLAWLTSK